MTKKQSPSYLNFDITKYAWLPDVNYREQPQKYRVGKGEQGVLICQPYKAEIGAHWRFRNVEIATESSNKIFAMFEDYIAQGDFVGADMARKYLQMGFTRARRYTNYKGGIKYDKKHNYALNEKGTGDPEKAKSAAIFYDKWQQAEANATYAQMKKDWKAKYG